MASAGKTNRPTLTALPETSSRGETVRPAGQSGSPLLRAAVRMALTMTLGVAVLRWLGDAIVILRDPNGGFDFISYYAAALALRDNPAANIYDLHVLQSAALAHHAAYPGTRYMYPPLLAVVLMPLTWLPSDTALRLWDVFNLLLWLACLVLIARLLRSLFIEARLAGLALPLDADVRLFLVAVVGFLTLTYDPLAAGIGLGQINVMVCFLVLLALDLERRGRPALAGASLAVASLLKVYPLVLLGYYALRGRWRVVGCGAIALGILVAGMLPVLGIQGLLVTRGLLAAGDTAIVLAHNEALLRAPLWIGILAGRQPDALVSILGALLVGLVGLTFVAGMLWIALRPVIKRLRLQPRPQETNCTADVFGYLWALCTMVLVAPVSWEHSYTWLLPAVALGFGYVLLVEPANRRATLILILITLSYALTTADFPLEFDHTEQFVLGPSILGHPVRPIFMLMRPFGALLLWIAIGWLFLVASRATDGHQRGSEMPHLSSRRRAIVLVGMLGAVVLARVVIVTIMALYGAAYHPAALIR